MGRRCADRRARDLRTTRDDRSPSERSAPAPGSNGRGARAVHGAQRRVWNRTMGTRDDRAGPDLPPTGSRALPELRPRPEATSAPARGSSKGRWEDLGLPRSRPSVALRPDRALGHDGPSGAEPPGRHARDPLRPRPVRATALGDACTRIRTRMAPDELVRGYRSVAHRGTDRRNPVGGLLGTGARSTERRSWQRVGNLTAWSRRCLECTRPCLVHRYQYASSLYSIVLFNVIVLQILSRILYT